MLQPVLTVRCKVGELLLISPSSLDTKNLNFDRQVSIVTENRMILIQR